MSQNLHEDITARHRYYSTGQCHLYERCVRACYCLMIQVFLSKAPRAKPRSMYTSKPRQEYMYLLSHSINEAPLLRYSLRRDLTNTLQVESVSNINVPFIYIRQQTAKTDSKIYRLSQLVHIGVVSKVSLNDQLLPTVDSCSSPFFGLSSFVLAR